MPTCARRVLAGPLNQASHWRNSDRVLGKDESEAGRKGPRCSGAALVQVMAQKLQRLKIGYL